MASIWLYDRGFNLSADQPNIEAAMSLHKAQLNPAIFGLNSIIKCQLETLTVVWYLDPWGPIWGCIFHFRFHMEMGHHPWIPQGFQHATWRCWPTPWLTSLALRRESRGLISRCRVSTVWMDLWGTSGSYELSFPRKWPYGSYRNLKSVIWLTALDIVL